MRDRQKLTAAFEAVIVHIARDNPNPNTAALKYLRRQLRRLQFPEDRADA